MEIKGKKLVVIGGEGLKRVLRRRQSTRVFIFGVGVW